MLSTRSELLDERELAMQGRSAEKRLQTLRRVTDLFLGGADRFSDEQWIGFVSVGDCED